MDIILLCVFVCSIGKIADASPSLASFNSDSNLWYQRNYVEEITPHANTAWGSWGSTVFCPEQAFARDFELKVSSKWRIHYKYNLLIHIHKFSWYYFWKIRVSSRLKETRVVAMTRHWMRSILAATIILVATNLKLGKQNHN